MWKTITSTIEISRSSYRGLKRQFLITGKTDEEIEQNQEEVRQSLAFYASTPSYRPVMKHHGWVDVGKQLHELSQDQDWETMVELIDDEILYTFAVEAQIDDLEDEIRKTQTGIVASVVVSPPRATGNRGRGLREIVSGLLDIYLVR